MSQEARTPSGPTTPKISLAVIVGNVEHLIERFVRSFAPLCDEMIFVRAIGNRDNNKAVSRAMNVCAELGITSIRDVYHNLPEHEDWPHVDHFADARNQAFKLARFNWVLWADTDDIIDPASIELVREALAQHHESVDGFGWDYHVPEDGLRVSKVRLVRRGEWAWRYAVHEELYATGENAPRLMSVEGATITHMPTTSRASHDERNLRILEAMAEAGTLTTGHRFHRIMTLRALGRDAEAMAEAMSLLSDPALGVPERYELFMVLGQMHDQEPLRAQMFLQALGTDPSRREAYGELAIWSCRNGQWPKMLGWTTAMMGLPRPSGYLWNQREQYYGHSGVRLHAMAHRLNGRRAAADVMQTNHFINHGAAISLLHATRGRPKQALAAQKQWLDLAENADRIEHIFGLDADDESAMPLAANLSFIVPPGGGCVLAWNACAQASRGKVLVQMSDDFVPPRFWDRLILERLRDVMDEPAVLAVSDGHRTDDLLCMAILTRARYEQQGYLFHPEFKSMYSDNFFTWHAHRDGVILDATDLVFEHRHPAFTGEPMDATYAVTNAADRYAEGVATFQRLTGPNAEGVSPTGYFIKDLHSGQFDCPQLAEWLIASMDPALPVHDLGCGNGYLVSRLTAAGFKATGYEGDPCHPDDVQCDLTRPLPLHGSPGHVLCIEVGEHIPASGMPALLRNLATACAPGAMCVMSWARPGQEGRGHVNCLPQETVMGAMLAAGFRYEPDTTDSLRSAVTEPTWLTDNLMVFKKL